MPFFLDLRVSGAWALIKRYKLEVGVVGALVRSDQLDRVREIALDAEGMRGRVSERTTREKSVRDERGFWSYVESLNLYD